MASLTGGRGDETHGRRPEAEVTGGLPLLGLLKKGRGSPPTQTCSLQAPRACPPARLRSSASLAVLSLSPPFTSRRTSHRGKQSEMREAGIFVARFEIDCVGFGSVYGSGSKIWYGFAAASTCFKLQGETSCFES